MFFFDERLARVGDRTLFERLEPLGRMAATKYNQPDAGIWELRGSSRIHTFSSVMCWAACDRLSRIAARLQLADRASAWREEANRIHDYVTRHCWNAQRNGYVAVADGVGIGRKPAVAGGTQLYDARRSPFRVHDSRHRTRIEARRLTSFAIRTDDFGTPENAFVVCTFWLVDALAAVGRTDDARALFQRLLSLRNRHGLFAEHIDPITGEAWGNFVQTYSMVGLINSAIRLSIPWDEAF